MAPADTKSNTSSGIRVVVVLPSISLFGLERAVLDLITGLQACNVALLCLVEATHGQRVRSALDAIGVDHAPVRVARRLDRPDSVVAGLKTLNALFCGRRDMARAVRQFVPTHVLVPSWTYAVYASRLLRPRRRRILWLHNPPASPRAGIGSRLVRYLWGTWLPRKFDLIVANSEYTRDRLSSFVGTDAARFPVIYPACERSLSVADPNHGANARRRLVFVGQLSEAKGLDCLLRVFAELAGNYPDVDLHILGAASSDDDEQRFRGMVPEALMESARVQFHGFVDDVQARLTGAYALVVPSRFEEPLGRVVLEAKWCSVPAVAFAVGGLTEVVRDGVSGLVCQHASDGALLKTIRSLLDQPTLQAKLAMGARASAERFSLSRCMQQWQQAFGNVS